MKYDFKQIEAKWQKNWDENETFKASNKDKSKPKFYGLVEFPYPSGHGLHVGHPRGYTAIDIITRKQQYISVVYHLVLVLCTFRLLN